MNGWAPGPVCACLGLLGACGGDDYDSGDDGDCTSHYETVVEAPDLARLKDELMTTDRGVVDGWPMVAMHRLVKGVRRALTRRNSSESTHVIT